ncbi:HK97 family phage prohead protease [Bradyrhizobium sp. 6(2017)]|uniref:HK97 family phage prohead protease n=1 Tax=Bradyrhizobium sp. 6(2017) TaxID=1197460 RepID=UPI0013E121C8|nr:HK97 family phage prohead protease [Bradyrhizobium sp. 6(2017)]QIG92880.1 HK97 family phage prohead protease [Bradyrhizobium sp. 6(2017)]
MTTFERRVALELRAGGDKKSPRLVGHAAVFNSPSQDLGGFTEIIRPGAFARSLASVDYDQLALVQHMPQLVLGRRSAGTLRLSEDQRGLAFEIDVPETSAARDLLVSVQRGDVRGASFAFSTPKNGDRWEVRGEKVIRELLDVNLHEVTITAQPAYVDTSVALRSLEKFQQPARRLAVKALRRFLETV